MKNWIEIFAIVAIGIGVASVVAGIRVFTEEPRPPTKMQPLALPNGKHAWFIETENGDRCTVVERNGKTALECRFKEEE